MRTHFSTGKHPSRLWLVRLVGMCLALHSVNSNAQSPSPTQPQPQAQPQAQAQSPIPDNLVVEGIPPFTDKLRENVRRYLEFRAASFSDWHPTERRMLIATRFAETPQLHLVDFPGGARRQITFLAEPVAGGAFQPVTGRCIAFAQDTGGGEFYQLYRYDIADGRITRLTDGKSRNTGGRWSHSGKWLAFSSTLRNGKDTDVYVMDPYKPEQVKRVLEVQGGGWGVMDWSWDDTKILLTERISINESWLYVLDVATGTRTPLFDPATRSGNGPKVSYAQASFGRDGKSVFWTTDQQSEFQQLFRYDLTSKKTTLLTGDIAWDIEDFDLAPDGKRIAVVSNEKGMSKVTLLDARTGRVLLRPELTPGVLSGLKWHQNGQELGMTLSSAQSPSDAYSLDAKSGKWTRWTASETGGLDASKFRAPELVEIPSFDGLKISGFLYRPDPPKFPGRRPLLINIHGGPESQSRPGFMARLNYYLEEMGVAIFLPNVRGSSGYGKTFLTLDNGFKREDSVKDIGAFLDVLVKDSGIQPDRIAVTGGSYGGYMSLACMIHYADRLRCGIDVVGISNFLTFLKNTQDYRRDLRRVEYGDERDPKMAEHLARISPTAHASKIKKPLLVVQGKNDPRVPLSEAEQMVKAIRDQGGKVWYLMAKDEGHGFAKKRNADFQMLATIQFLQTFLME